jgi:hypothetical protein
MRPGGPVQGQICAGQGRQDDLSGVKDSLSIVLRRLRSGASVPERVEGNTYMFG